MILNIILFSNITDWPWDVIVPVVVFMIPFLIAVTMESNKRKHPTIIIVYEVIPELRPLFSRWDMKRCLGQLEEMGYLISVQDPKEPISEGYVARMTMWSGSLMTNRTTQLVGIGYFDKLMKSFNPSI